LTLIICFCRGCVWN